MRDNHPRQVEIFEGPPPHIRGKNFMGAHQAGYRVGIEGDRVSDNPYYLVADTGFGRAFFKTWLRGWHKGHAVYEKENK